MRLFEGGNGRLYAPFLGIFSPVLSHPNRFGTGLPLHLSSATCLDASWAVSDFRAPIAFQMVIKFFKLTRNRFSIYRPSSPTNCLRKSQYAFFDRSILALPPLQPPCVIPFFFEAKNALMLLLLVKVMW